MTTCKFCKKPIELAYAEYHNSHDMCLNRYWGRVNNATCTRCGKNPLSSCISNTCNTCNGHSEWLNYPGPDI